MAGSQSDSKFTEWESNTSSELHSTLRQMRAEAPPQHSVDGVIDWASSLGCEQTGSSASAAPTSVDRDSGQTWYTASRRYAVIAAGIAALLLLSVTWFFPASAWAQVVEAVAAKPWIRLSLQRPETELPVDEVFQEVVMWFRGDGSIAAIQSAQQSTWVDLKERAKFEFQPQYEHVTLTKLGTVESTQIQTLLSTLSPFQSDAFESSDLELKNRSEVNFDDREYIDFSFESRNVERSEAAFPLLVRVEKSTMLPTHLTIREARFEIDYPAVGPNDIYALNVPQNIEVADLRNLEKYFHKRDPLSPAAYEAVELIFFAWMEGKQLLEAARYRYTNGEAVCERTDSEQVFTLTQEKWETKESASPAWWIEQLADLDHQTVELSGNNFPHNRCYRAYGGIESYDSASVSSLQGLEGTIEIHGDKMSVWLDPDRDLIVRRYERVDDSGTISVFQIDEVLQDANGVWFATRWRQGNVGQRGELLSDTKRVAGQPGVSTTVHIATIRFSQ